jgi:hypothetical protein
LLTADHKHPDGAVTVTVPVPPVLPSVTLPGEIENEQAVPLSVIEKVSPAMVRDPLSAPDVLLELTE